MKKQTVTDEISRMININSKMITVLEGYLHHDSSSHDWYYMGRIDALKIENDDLAELLQKLTTKETN